MSVYAVRGAAAAPAPGAVALLTATARGEALLVDVATLLGVLVVGVTTMPVTLPFTVFFWTLPMV
jgi:hypothetical protein